MFLGNRRNESSVGVSCRDLSCTCFPSFKICYRYRAILILIVFAAFATIIVIPTVNGAGRILTAFLYADTFMRKFFPNCIDEIRFGSDGYCLSGIFQLTTRTTDCPRLKLIALGGFKFTFIKREGYIFSYHISDHCSKSFCLRICNQISGIGVACRDEADLFLSLTSPSGCILTVNNKYNVICKLVTGFRCKCDFNVIRTPLYKVTVRSKEIAVTDSSCDAILIPCVDCYGIFVIIACHCIIIRLFSGERIGYRCTNRINFNQILSVTSVGLIDINCCAVCHHIRRVYNLSIQHCGNGRLELRQNTLTVHLANQFDFQFIGFALNKLVACGHHTVVAVIPVEANQFITVRSKFI